jgi:hypothetical protein
MATDHTNPTNAGKDELKSLPDNVARELAAHLEQYKKDPVAAHYWDPICIGVPGGPVACLLLTHTGRKSSKPLDSVLQYYRRGNDVAIVGSRGGTAVPARGLSRARSAARGGSSSSRNSRSSASTRRAQAAKSRSSCWTRSPDP